MVTTTSASNVDIIVTTPDNELLMVVEVKSYSLTDSQMDQAIAQLKQYMLSTACMMGLLVAAERLILLKDSFEQFDGSSITILGEARLPASLLPASEKLWGHPSLDFEARVQAWLESLQNPLATEALPDDLQDVFNPFVLNILQSGDVRSAGPRWNKMPM